jgi:hypothetical protein
MANTLNNFTNNVTVYNRSSDTYESGKLYSLNGISFIAAEDIAAAASGTVIIPNAVNFKTTLVISEAAAFGTPLYGTGTSVQTVSITGNSTSVYVGRSLTSVSSVAAAQSIDVALFESKPSFVA